MVTDKTGGPAFPREDYQANGRPGSPLGQQGMSLHDYYAGQVLLALAITDAPELCARKCFDYADAMIEERSKREEKTNG